MAPDLESAEHAAYTDAFSASSDFCEVAEIGGERASPFAACRGASSTASSASSRRAPWTIFPSSTVKWWVSDSAGLGSELEQRGFVRDYGWMKFSRGVGPREAQSDLRVVRVDQGRADDFATLTARGMPSALSVIALSERGTMFDPGPCVYMEKLAGSSEFADLPPASTTRRGGRSARVAERKQKPVGDVTTIMLDRPRHEAAIAEIREVGARIRLISDGDVSAALFAVSAEAGVDLLWGIGGTPEGVLSAAAIKCLGGELLGRLWPRDDSERQAAVDAGYDLDEILDVDRLVSGKDVFFAATGVTDGDLLQGVRYSRGKATTESLITRSRSGTVRTVSARHDQAKLREITGGRFG